MYTSHYDIVRKRPVGRPAENPFPTQELEEELYRKAQKAVKLYFDHSEENTKKPFVFFPDLRMGMTAFWALIYYYYLVEKHMSNNVKYFVDGLMDHIGKEHVGNRPDIDKNVNRLRGCYPQLSEPWGVTGVAKKDYDKFHPRYVDIVHIWECL